MNMLLSKYSLMHVYVSICILVYTFQILVGIVFKFNFFSIALIRKKTPKVTKIVY